MNCETCIHEHVCRFRGDFIELFTKASNDVYGNMFDLSCNEYRMSEAYKNHIGIKDKEVFNLDKENIRLLEMQIKQSRLLKNK